MKQTNVNRVGAVGRASRFAVALAWLVLGVAHADYVWLQRDGEQMKVLAGELHKPLPHLPAMRDAHRLSADGGSSPLPPQAAAFHLGATASADQRFAATLPGANGVLTYHQARFGRQEIQPVHDLELVPSEPGGDTFRLFFKGKPVAAGQVNVATSEGWRRTLSPAPDGSVSFKPWFPGLYVLEVTARVNNGSVTIDGQRYDDVRHAATLSFEIQP